MEQAEKYTNIWGEFNDASKAVLNKKYLAEEVFNVTCDLKLDSGITEKIQEVSNVLKAKFPENYYLPSRLGHVTICSIMKLSKEFDQFLLDGLQKKVKEVASNFSSFELEFNGLNHFPNVLFAQVFSKDEALFELNELLVKKLGLKPKRDYVPHSTVAYFESNPEGLFKEVERKYRGYSFGKMRVKEICFARYDLHPKIGYYEPAYMKVFTLK